MKKTLLGVAAAAVLASTAGAHVFEGVYTGAQVGYSHSSTTMKILSGNGQTNATNRNHSSSSATLTAIVGYSGLWNTDHVYGVELRGGYDTQSNKKSGDKLTMDWTIGARGRYGYVLGHDWMPFLSLGVDYSHGKYKYTRGIERLDDNFRVWEVVPGVGVEWSLSDHVNFRADYEFAFNVNDRGLNADKVQLHKGPHRHHVRVGVVWNF